MNSLTRQLSRRVFRAACVLLSCVSMQVLAQVQDVESPGPVFVDPAPDWREQATVLPDYPLDSDLLPFPVDIPGSSLLFNIDGRSLAVGADGVVRYTVVIVSASGARNVMFEGIRCATREYRVYAYGESNRRFRAVTDDRWQRTNKPGWGRYRAELQRYYLCNESLLPVQPGEIVRRLRHSRYPGQ